MACSEAQEKGSKPQARAEERSHRASEGDTGGKSRTGRNSSAVCFPKAHFHASPPCIYFLRVLGPGWPGLISGSSVEVSGAQACRPRAPRPAPAAQHLEALAESAAW